MEKEEGEMSDDNAMLVDDLEEPIEVVKSNRTVLYKAEKNGIVVEQLEKIDSTKLEERAKRFGLNLYGSRLVTQTQIDELYVNSGIESGNERHFRFDALHLNGVDGLTAKDIFEYLEDYKPVSLEKVDDVSCNVVCQDHISVALALLVHSREIKNEEIRKMLAEKSDHHWREGMPHPKKDLILMRFATNGDKKVSKKKPDGKHSDEYYDQSMDSVSKNPWGDLCKSWGVYDHQETFQRMLPKNDYEEDVDGEEPNKTVKIRNKRLAMRLGKRTHKIEESDESSSDSEWKKKSKTPRMRMHADDVEAKHQNKKQQVEISKDEGDAYAPLSIEVMNSQSNYTPRETTKLSDKFKKIFRSETNQRKERVHSRLGAKVVPAEEIYSDCSSDNSDHNIMSRVQKVTTATKSTSVWSRLATQSSKDNSQSDLRQVLKLKQKNPVDKQKDPVDMQKNPIDKYKNPVDLRGRIGKSKKTNLRIEIDNNYAS